MCDQGCTHRCRPRNSGGVLKTGDTKKARKTNDRRTKRHTSQMPNAPSKHLYLQKSVESSNTKDATRPASPGIRTLNGGHNTPHKSCTPHCGLAILSSGLLLESGVKDATLPRHPHSAHTLGTQANQQTADYSNAFYPNRSRKHHSHLFFQNDPQTATTRKIAHPLMGYRFGDIWTRPDPVVRQYSGLSDSSRMRPRSVLTTV
jgi:hypothetical protein